MVNRIAAQAQLQQNKPEVVSGRASKCYSLQTCYIADWDTLVVKSYFIYSMVELNSWLWQFVDCRGSRFLTLRPTTTTNNSQQWTKWTWEITTWLCVYCVMWLYFVLKCVVNQRTSKSSSVQLHPYKSVFTPVRFRDNSIYFCMVLYNLLIILYCANLKTNMKWCSNNYSNVICCGNFKNPSVLSNFNGTRIIMVILLFLLR